MGGVLGGVGGGIAAAWQGNNPLTNAPRSGADAGKILPNWGKRWTKTGKGWMLSGVRGSGYSNQFPDAILPDGSTHIGGQYSFDGQGVTAHGAERIAGPAATRGGVLSMEGVNATRSFGRTFTQADGANVFLHEISPGRFNAVVQNQTTGKIITTMSNWSQKSINRIGKNYGWPIQ